MNEYIESLNGASKKQMDKLRRKYNRKVRHYEELKIKYKEQHQQLKRFEDLEE